MDGDYDIAVIGGGINGAGIARDAARRGLRVILLEKNDFGSGTSSWSSRLIHGGLRYLEHGEIPLVFESLSERRCLLDIAPHLVKPLKLTIPIFSGGRRSRFLIRLGMLAYDLLSLGRNMPRHRMLSRDEMIREIPSVKQDGLVGGAQYYDAQVVFAERLVLENVIAASEAGATVRNYSSVIGVNVQRGAVNSLQYVDQATAEESEIRARVIINAAGPWVDRVLATVNREMKQYMGGTKGCHIVVGEFDGAPDSALYVEAKADGRPYFIIPWNDQFLIGTTDIRYEGDPGEVTASKAEVDYLLAEANHVFPAAGLGREDIHYAYAGVRPLPRRQKGPESAITRKHIIQRHRRIARGLFSIIGGKLTTYRNLAEQTVDKAARRLRKDVEPCTTDETSLPGGGDIDAARDRLQTSRDLSLSCIDRLLAVYGSRAADIAQSQSPVTFVDDRETVLASEVVHAIRNEYAVTMIDIVHRRLMVGLNADLGASMIGAIADVAAGEAGWDRQRKKGEIAALEKYNARLRSSQA